MVAASGAGPEPIPYRSLTALGLARAITTCLAPETQLAARQVADRMSADKGVKTAVQSFHAQLPGNVRCDIIEDEAAAWTFREGNNTMRLSKKVAAVLLRQSMLKPDKLIQ